MLFHITHTHSATNCSAKQPERQAAFGQVMQTAAEYDVTIKGAYADGPGHTVYILAETDDALNLAQLLYPVLEYGHYDIRPIVGVRELMEAAPGNGSPSG